MWSAMEASSKVLRTVLLARSSNLSIQVSHPAAPELTSLVKYVFLFFPPPSFHCHRPSPRIALGLQVGSAPPLLLSVDSRRRTDCGNCQGVPSKIHQIRGVRLRQNLIEMRSAVVSLLAAAAGASATSADGVFEFTPNLVPLQENAGTDKLFPMGDCFGFNLEEATIDGMQEAMRNGTLTSVKLVTCYMTRTFQTQQYIK